MLLCPAHIALAPVPREEELAWRLWTVRWRVKFWITTIFSEVKLAFKIFKLYTCMHLLQHVSLCLVQSVLTAGFTMEGCTQCYKSSKALCESSADRGVSLQKQSCSKALIISYFNPNL